MPFIIALFEEMYGFPLSIFLLSGSMGAHYPGVDFLSHNNGHLIPTHLGLKGGPHFDVFHLLSNIFGGFLMLTFFWHVLWSAQRQGKLATTGIYAIRRVHYHHARISAAVAHSADARHVPYSIDHVPPSRSQRSTGH